MDAALEKTRIKKFFWVLGLVAAGAALLLFSRPVTDAVGDSAFYCLTVLIPSLFPFMALTSFAVGSPAGEGIGRLFGGAVRWAFRLPECCAAPVLLSFIGGYPAGAKGASMLLERGEIDREQAGRMLLFCVNPGPAFVVTFLGVTILGDPRAGWVLFLSVAVSGLVLGVLSGLGSPVPPKRKPGQSAPVGSALTQAASDASKSVVAMCACILLFAAFLAVLRASGIFGLLCRGLSVLPSFDKQSAPALLSFLFEVTGGVGDGIEFQAGPSLYAFGLAFGGLCVHLQVFSFFREFPGKKWKFFLFRLLHGGLAAGLCKVFVRLLPGEPVPAWAVSGVRQISPLSGTLAGGLSLLLMCMAFLVITGDGLRRP